MENMKLITNAIRYIQENPLENLSLQSIAEKVTSGKIKSTRFFKSNMKKIFGKPI